MARPELSETLTALVGAVPVHGPTVTEVDLDVPMEVTLARRGAELVVRAAPGHTRFVSGILPVVHRTRVHIVVGPGPAAPGASRDDAFPCATPPGWS